MTTQENMRYYESRLELVRTLFLEGDIEILSENSDKIRKLVSQYRNISGYNPTLAAFPETFLGIN